MMYEKLKEQTNHIKQDFYNELEKLHTKDGKYTLNEILALGAIGATLTAMMELKEEHKDKTEKMEDSIEEELMGAEHYHNCFIKTGEQAYKQMAKDELKHADFFIKQARTVANDKESQAKIQSYLSWYNTLLHKIGQ